jgi:hypothetical protein
VYRNNYKNFLFLWFSLLLFLNDTVWGQKIYISVSENLSNHPNIQLTLQDITDLFSQVPDVQIVKNQNQADIILEIEKKEKSLHMIG